jgi:hypothetical protein
LAFPIKTEPRAHGKHRAQKKARLAAGFFVSLHHAVQALATE